MTLQTPEPDARPSQALELRPPAAGDLNPITDSWVHVVRDVSRLAAQICGTEFVPTALRPQHEDDWQNAAARVAAVILHGRELGLPPMTALAQTHVIEGRPALSAEGMRALILSHGHSITIAETNGARCVMRGRRKGESESTTITWTLEDARRAALLAKKAWERYPRQMLLARATGELARAIFPDVIHGLAIVEELADEPAGEPEPEPRPERTQHPTVRRGLAAVKAPAESAAEPPPGAAERPAAPTDGAAASTPENRPQRPQRTRPGVPRRGQQTAGDDGAPARSGDVVAPDPGGLGDAEQHPAEPAAPEPQPQSENVQPEPEIRGPIAITPEPEPEPEPEPIELDPRKQFVSLSQRAAIMAHWTRLKVNDRDERLAFTSELIGREVDTTNHVTVAEALELLDRLSKIRDRAALEQAIADHVAGAPSTLLEDGKP